MIFTLKKSLLGILSGTLKAENIFLYNPSLWHASKGWGSHNKPYKNQPYDYTQDSPDSQTCLLFLECSHGFSLIHMLLPSLE